jgi:hypothetical protein
MSDFDQVLAQLKSHPQVAGIYPQYLHGATASLLGSTLTVQVKGQAVAWLARLRPVIERVAADVYSRQMTVLFVASPEGEAIPPSSPVGACSPAPRPFLINVAMVFDHGNIVGYAQHSHYLSQFWRAYLGALPMDVWDHLRSYCKDATLQWTPPVRMTGVELARRVGHHPQRITGVWRNCPHFDKVLAETGSPIKCCGRYAHSKMTVTKPTPQYPNSRPVCRHWVPGALDLLEAEGLLVYRKHGRSTKAVHYELQIFQRPPLLTPRQAARLSKPLQQRHLDYIRGLYSSQGYSLEAWSRIEAYTFMALRPAADVLLGLELPRPKAGVLCAVARNGNLLPSTAHNHIFFASSALANEANYRADGSPLAANADDSGT